MELLAYFEISSENQNLWWKRQNDFIKLLENHFPNARYIWSNNSCVGYDFSTLKNSDYLIFYQLCCCCIATSFKILFSLFDCTTHNSNFFYPIIKIYIFCFKIRLLRFFSAQKCTFLRQFEKIPKNIHTMWCC